MVTELTYKLERDDLKEAIKEVLGEVLAENYFLRYEGIIVGSTTACEILKITNDTLYKYIKLGYIEPIERSGTNYKFDLAYLHRLNIKSIKGRKIK